MKPVPQSRAEKALLGIFGAGVHDHIAWEIFIEGSQAIAEPSTQTGSSRHLAAGLNVGNRRIVIDRLGIG